MKPKNKLLRLTCRQAADLLIAREDQTLAISDQFALKLHLLACAACPEFEAQVLTLRTAMGRWRSYTGEPADDAGTDTPATVAGKSHP